MKREERDADDELESTHCIVLEVERERDELLELIDVQTGEHDQNIRQGQDEKQRLLRTNAL